MDRPSRQKISKDMVELNSTINHLDVIDISELFNSTTADYIFFSLSHGTFTEINYLLGHKIIKIFVILKSYRVCV